MRPLALPPDLARLPLKMRAIAAVGLLLIVPAVLVGPVSTALSPPAAPMPVEFGTSFLRAGEVNAIPVSFKAPGVLIELPPGFFPVVADQIRTRLNVTDADAPQGVLRVLVPPTVAPAEFKVRSPQGAWTHTFEVVAGMEPVVSGEDAIGQLEQITQAYQFRFSTSPKLLRAAEHFRDLFTGLGLTARMYFYPWRFESRPTPLDTAINIVVVCGFQQGAQAAGEYIVIGGHMDSVPQAVEGAYDDGSGTSAVLEVAQGLSQFTTRRSVAYCLWGGEEEGLYGSRMWVAHDLPGTVKLYINMDMAGLSWPAPFNFTAFVGPDENEATAEHPRLVSLLENQTEREFGYPREGNFTIIEDPFGRSDHVSFWSTGAATVFFFGADDVEYPEYHSLDDTFDTMVGHAGDRATLANGFDTLVWMALYLAVHADQEELD